MNRRPPISTRTDTLFPYTTLFRSRGLDVPPLATVPPDHVLTKSFYLMQEFPGRWADGQVWVEARSEEHTSELQSLMRSSYAVFCLTKKKHHTRTHLPTQRYNILTNHTHVHTPLHEATHRLIQ